jgi:hypothetical protein
LGGSKSNVQQKGEFMKRRLGGVIALIEIVSVTALLFLLGQEGLPARIGVSLVFFLPIAFGLHVFEEFIFPGGASDWFKIYRPQYAKAYTESYLFKVNALPLVLSVLVSLGTFDYKGAFSFFGIRAWLAFLFFLALNAVFHIRGTIQTKQYSPGLGVSIVLYIPLAIISFTYLLRTGVIDIFSAIVCVAVGSLIQPVLDYIKERSLEKEGQQHVIP